MNKIRIYIVFFICLSFLAVVVVHGKVQGQTGLKEPAGKAVIDLSGDNIKSADIPKKSAFKENRQSFQLAADLLGGIGGYSQSVNYRISANSGGQLSPIGISQSSNYSMKAGYVYAVFVRCGDANGDGQINVADAVYIINYVFKNGPVPTPPDAGDANCDINVDVADAVYLINYVFKSGPEPCCP